MSQTNGGRPPAALLAESHQTGGKSSKIELRLRRRLIHKCLLEDNRSVGQRSKNKRPRIYYMDGCNLDYVAVRAEVRETVVEPESCLNGLLEHTSARLSPFENELVATQILGEELSLRQAGEHYGTSHETIRRAMQRLRLKLRTLILEWLASAE